jgi:O-antigen ligase
MAISPQVCLGAVIAFTIFRFAPAVELGAVHAGIADGFFGGLVLWWILDVGRGREPEGKARELIPVWPILVLLTWIAVTIVLTAPPGKAGDPTVAFLRLLQTAMIGVLAARYIRTAADVRVMLWSIVIGAVAAIAFATSGTTADAGGSLRGDPDLDPNAIGLASGLLVLLAVFPALTRRALPRVLLAAVGIGGLVGSSSIGALVGTSVAIGVGLALLGRPRVGPRGAKLFAAFAGLLLAGAVAWAGASLMRPDNLPTAERFRHSSTYVRAVVAAGGVELAKQNPWTGVGWRQSSEHDVIGDPAVTRELRADFRNAPDAVFPDVSPASVHNSYVQIAAELGVVGLALFVALIGTVVIGMRRAFRRTRHGTSERMELAYIACALLLVAVWLNDNALYGGQIETVVCAVLVGAIAGRAAGMRPLPADAGEPEAARDAGPGLPPIGVLPPAREMTGAAR